MGQDHADPGDRVPTLLDTARATRGRTLCERIKMAAPALFTMATGILTRQYVRGSGVTMPVQKLSAVRVDRPSGLVPPELDETGVTEIRVHGVGGTAPESQLTDLAPLQVAGDRVAGFYRTADAQGRHVEAYSWGGLTSRSGTRILWLLLLPFMLANLAGWMGTRTVMTSRRLASVHRWTTRWVALAMTINVFLIFALITMDALAYQCGGQRQCVQGRWWLAPITWAGGLDYPGRRIVLGAVPLVLGALVLVAFSYRSRTRYEAVAPPHRVEDRATPPRSSAAVLEEGLLDGRFWHGTRASTRLGRCHLAAVLAFLALAVLCTTHQTMDWASADERWSFVWTFGVLLAVLVMIASATLLTLEDAPDWTGVALVASAAVVGVLAVGYAWLQPAAPSPAGSLPAMRLLTNATHFFVLLSLAPALVLALWAAVKRDRTRDDGTFPWGGAFIVCCLGIALLNAVLLGILIRVAELAGDVQYVVSQRQPGFAQPDQAWVYLSPMVATAAPYLTLVPIAIWIAFLVFELRRYLAAGSRTHRLAIAEEYRATQALEPSPPPAPARPDAWYESALAEDGAPRERLRASDAWLRKVGRARWFAQARTDIAWALIAIVVVGLVVLVVAEWYIWVPPRTGPWAPDWFIAAGTVVASLLPLVLLGTLRWGWRRPQGRRLIGVLWDVGTFWPRAYHPWAPPSYAERAVPELQRRMWWLHDSGGRVLVAAHSQGTVVAAAALLQADCRPADDVVALVTFGSPLRTLYRWAFPAYFTDDVLRTLATQRRLRTWRNYHYLTDFIGGPVLPGPDDPPVDRMLSDPAGTRHLFRQAPPTMRRHTGYWTDPRMWQDIDAIAADMGEAAWPAGRTPPVEHAPREHAPGEHAGSTHLSY